MHVLFHGSPSGSRVMWNGRCSHVRVNCLVTQCDSNAPVAYFSPPFRPRRVTLLPTQVLQIEVHPLYQQREVREFASALGINVTAYSSLGEGRDDLLGHPDVVRIATSHSKTSAQVRVFKRSSFHQVGLVAFKFIPPSTAEWFRCDMGI